MSRFSPEQWDEIKRTWIKGDQAFLDAGTEVTKEKIDSYLNICADNPLSTGENLVVLANSVALSIGWDGACQVYEHAIRIESEMQETLGGIYACWLSKADELLFHLQMSDADRLKISIDAIHLIRRSMEGNHNNMFSLAVQCGQVYFQIPGRTAEHLAAAEYWLQCAIAWAVPDFDLEHEIEIAKEFLRKIEVLRKNSDESQDGSTK